MATNYNPRIVTDGLVLALDAGNTKSYPGYWSPTLSNGANAFDGNLSTAAGGLGGTFGPYTYTFANPIAITSARMYVTFGASSGQVGSRTNVFLVNGIDVTQKAKDANLYALTAGWIDVTAEAGSNWSTFQFTGTSGSTNPGIYAIEINGKIIVGNYNGTTWTDLSGNGNNGSLENGVGYNSGNLGSLSFDGSNDYGRVYSFDYESISNNLYSWEIWFKILSYSPYTSPMILSNRSGVGFNDRLVIVSADNYMFWGAKNTSNSTTYARAEFAPTPNEWYHFVGTMDWGNSVKMYINGQFINENYNSIWGTKRTDGSDLYIGRRADGTNNAHCEISVFKWYAKELNSTEIQQNYNATKSRFQ